MIYLDNSATTKVAPEVYEAMLPYFCEEYGNPSSKYYTLAVNAKEGVEKARQQVANLINGKPEEIIFTCGATESNNTIIKGIADYKKHYEKIGNHIITSKAEHHATLNTCKFLNGDVYSNNDITISLNGQTQRVDRGYEVTFLNVNSYGQITHEDFEDALTDQTILASIIWGNNEIGSLNNITTLSSISKKRNVFFHSDATQVLGKIEIDTKKTMVDALSFSAHKLNGPKGVGALWVRCDEFGCLPPFTSLLHGGEQEGGLRAGTHNVPGIIGFGKAADLAKTNYNKRQKELLSLDRQIRDIIATIPELELNGSPSNYIPGIYNITVLSPGFNNELFIKQTSDSTAISSGSACTLGEPSHVLAAIGKSDYASRVLRISVNYNTSIKDIKHLIGMILP